jgi:hypothetical protein
MTEVAVTGPRGTLMVEVRGVDVLEAEKVAFPSVPRVPQGEVYVGPEFDHYKGGDGPDRRGRFVDISKLGRVTPGHKANRVVLHGARHTDWYKGEWAVSYPEERAVQIDTAPMSSGDDTRAFYWRSIGTINPTHDEHATRSAFGFSDFGAAADSLR